MNRSKGAALLLLFGAFAVGGASTYAIMEWKSRPTVPNRCRERVERNYRQMFYESLNFTDRQKFQWDSLIDSRNAAINEVFAIPRAKQDSIRADVREKQRAILTEPQRISLDERQSAMSRQQEDRRKECERQQASSKDNKSTSSK